jgi:hypothetical protein
MRVLRDGPGNSQSELPCITRPLWLRTVTHRPVGPIGLYMYCASFACRVTHRSRHLAGSAVLECFLLILSIFYYYSLYD